MFSHFSVAALPVFTYLVDQIRILGRTFPKRQNFASLSPLKATYFGDQSSDKG